MPGNFLHVRIYIPGAIEESKTDIRRLGIAPCRVEQGADVVAGCRIQASPGFQTTIQQRWVYLIELGADAVAGCRIQASPGSRLQLQQRWVYLILPQEPYLYE